MLFFQLMEMVVVLRASCLMIHHSAVHIPPHTVFSPMCLFVPISKFLSLIYVPVILLQLIQFQNELLLKSVPFSKTLSSNNNKKNYINCCQGLRIQHLSFVGWDIIQRTATLLIGMIPQEAIETHISGVHCPWSVFWNTFQTCQSYAEMFERGIELRIFITTSASRIPQSNL